MRNLTMIGMPSSGKSVIGVLLAKRLGMSFLDLDLLIQERSGKLLRQLIEEHGREGFLRIEEGYASALSVQNTVISPGGSICYEREAMRHLREISTIIYLDISYPEMERRIGDVTARGVAIPEGYTLLDLYWERAALYEKDADIRIDEEGLSPEETAERIIELLGKRG